MYSHLALTNNKPVCVCVCGRHVGVVLIIYRFPCGFGSKIPPFDA